MTGYCLTLMELESACLKCENRHRHISSGGEKKIGGCNVVDSALMDCMLEDEFCQAVGRPGVCPVKAVRLSACRIGVEF